MARYINADALQVQLERKKAGVANQRYTEGWNDCMMRIKSMVSKAPTVDAVPVVYGQWVPVYESELTGWNPSVAGRDPIGGYFCSKCHYEAVYSCNDEYVLSDYCPGCGARMDGEEDE